MGASFVLLYKHLDFHRDRYTSLYNSTATFDGPEPFGPSIHVGQAPLKSLTQNAGGLDSNDSDSDSEHARGGLDCSDSLQDDDDDEGEDDGPRRSLREKRPPAYLVDFETDLPFDGAGKNSTPTIPAVHAFAYYCRTTGPIADLAEMTEAIKNSKRSIIEPPTDVENLRGIVASITCAQYKLEMYLKKMETCPVYWCAMILHPGYRGRWIDRYLKPQVKSAALQAFRDLYDAEYKNYSPSEQQPSTSARPLPRDAHVLAPHDSDAEDDFYDPEPDPLQRDEVEEYLNSPLNAVPNILEWWQAHNHQYPRLAKMAFDVLSTPASSCECERCFSLTKLTMSTQRHSLSDATLEQLALLKNWLKKEFGTPGLILD